MRLRLLALVPIALFVLVGSTLPRALAQCAPADTFTFQVERPNGAHASGLQIGVQAGGKAGVRRATSVVDDSGNISLCIRNASSGEMVEIHTVSADYRVLYPSRGRLPLSHEDSPSIVVCEARSDCTLNTTAEVIRLLHKAQPQVRPMTASEREAFFRDWVEYTRQVSQDTNANNAKLLTALVRKERQVAAASRAAILLKRFANRARELLVRFDRHAEQVLVQRDRAVRASELKEMNEAYVAYNPVFDELTEQSEAYLTETGDYWSPEVSVGLRALFDEALRIHHDGIYPLNTASTLINHCVRKLPECPGSDTARAAVQRATKSVREVTLPQLDRFEARSKGWLGALDDQLFDHPTTEVPASPPARR